MSTKETPTPPGLSQLHNLEPLPGPLGAQDQSSFGHHFLGSVFTEPMFNVVSRKYIYESFYINYCFNDNHEFLVDDTNCLLPLILKDISIIDLAPLNYGLGPKDSI